MTDYSRLSIDELATIFAQLRNIMDTAELEYKTKLAEQKSELALISEQLNAKMMAEDLSKISPANGGLVYFITKTRVDKDSSTDFIDFIKQNNKWDLLKAEPMKKSIIEFVNSTGAVPPGIRYEVVKELAYRK